MTPKQYRVLKFIADYNQKNGKSPTIIEIRDAMEVISTSHVYKFILILERDGYITRSKGMKGGIRIIKLPPSLAPAYDSEADMGLILDDINANPAENLSTIVTKHLERIVERERGGYNVT